MPLFIILRILSVGLTNYDVFAVEAEKFVATAQSLCVIIVTKEALASANLIQCRNVEGLIAFQVLDSGMGKSSAHVADDPREVTKRKRCPQLSREPRRIPRHAVEAIFVPYHQMIRTPHGHRYPHRRLPRARMIVGVVASNLFQVLLAQTLANLMIIGPC